MRWVTVICITAGGFFYHVCSGAELTQLQNWDAVTYPRVSKKLIQQMEFDPHAKAGNGNLLKVKIGANKFIQKNGFLVADRFNSPDGITYKTTLTYHGLLQ